MARHRSLDRKRRRKGPLTGLWISLAVLTLVTVALAAAWRYTALSELITAERIDAWAKAARATPWAPLVMVAAYTPATFLMLPRQVLTICGAIAFGPWLGFTYAMVGMTLSAVVAYYVGLALSPKAIERMTGGSMDRFKKVVRRHGVVAVFTLRVLPTLPFVVESMVAGALRVKLWHYVVGTALALAPGVLATTVFGHQIAAALSDVSQINYWLIGAVVVFFLLSIYATRRLLADKD
jgi:uncharacterized membrane protein YdjX (TVP38/TMEM64 family)